MMKELLLYILQSERKTFRNNLIGMVAFIALATIASSMVMYDMSEGELHAVVSYSRSVTFINAIFIILVVAGGSSRMLNCMRTKEKAISFLMLPASNMQKFLTRAIIGTVGVALMFCVALIFADAIQALYHMGVYRSAGSITWEMLNQYSTDNNSVSSMLGNAMDLWETIEWCVFFHAIFTLGATLFKKNPFIKTAAIIILVGMFLVAALTYICTEIALYDNELAFNLIHNSSTAQEIIGRILMYAFIVFCYGCSYFRFCRKTIA